MTEQLIHIPYKPNSIQSEVHKSLKRFNVVVLHRGAGKSYLAVNELVRRAFTCEARDGAVFVYVAPEKQQAKRVIWQKLKYFVQPINDAAIASGEPELRINEAELTVTFPDNGAVIRLEGADEPDRLRGIHPHGVVLDEVGQMKRDLWSEVVYPSLKRNKGWIIFIGTPKGDNLFRELYDLAGEINDPEWYRILRDVYSTDVFIPEEIEATKRVMPPAKFEQEYLCSFQAIFTGAYYSGTLLDPEKGIIADVPYNPMYPVITAWDLGTADPTAVWFVQQIDGKHHFIDYYEHKDEDFFFHLRKIQAMPYMYSYHIMPHDVCQRGWQSNLTRESILKSQGMKYIRAPKPATKISGIPIVQAGLYTSRFDANKCEKGLRQLLAYRSKVNAMTGEETGEPIHDGFDGCKALETYFTGAKKQYLEDVFDSYGLSFTKNEVLMEHDLFGGY